MKKLILMASVIALLAACNANTGETTTDETTVIKTDSFAPVTTVETVTVAKYTPAEGDVRYKDNQLMVWKGNEWVIADKDVTLDNGVVVYKNGEVKKEGKTVKLEDGEVVTGVGKFFDKTGEAIEDAWDSTKKGVKQLGDDIDKAAKDVKESVEGDRNK